MTVSNDCVIRNDRAKTSDVRTETAFDVFLELGAGTDTTLLVLARELEGDKENKGRELGNFALLHLFDVEAFIVLFGP